MSEELSSGIHWSGGISAAAVVDPEEDVLIIANSMAPEYAYSHDGGENWHMGHTLEKKVNDFFVLDPCHIWMACDGGYIYFLSGVAEPPMAQEAGVLTDRDLLSIDFADKERGYAVGGKGVILFTWDGGRTWIIDGFVSQDALRKVVAVPGTDTVLVLDNSGCVYQSSDYGQTWRIMIPGFGVADIVATDQGIYFFDTKAHEVFYSQDGGMTWKTEYLMRVTSDQPPADLSAVEWCSQE